MMRVAVMLIVSSALWLCPSADAAGDPRLKELYEQDQADRRLPPDKTDWFEVGQRDKERQAKVLDMVRAGRLVTSDDFFHAAMVFQHGSTVEDIELAHALATVASRFEPPNSAARWLTAASLDRLLMRRKKPQWYGTQFVRNAGKWELYPVDESAVSDAEREGAGVPTLAASRARAAKMNEAP